MSELVQVVSDVGFPIFVSMFILLRLESKFDALRTSIEKLPEQLKEQLNS